MQEQIPAAQSRIYTECNFSEMLTESELGHLANLANNMRHKLLNIRVMMINYQPNGQAANQFRKCPHCGKMWAKFYGCDGSTTCGAAHGASETDGVGVEQPGGDTLLSFEFTFQQKRLRFKRNSDVAVKRSRWERDAKLPYGAGCGKSITWSAMAVVGMDEMIPGLGVTMAQFIYETQEASIPTVEDVNVIQTEYVSSWSSYITDKFKALAPMSILTA